jgi:hypothetical protein
MDPNANLTEMRRLAARILSDDVLDDDVVPSEAEARALRLWFCLDCDLAKQRSRRRAEVRKVDDRRQHRDTLVDAVMACEHTSGPTIETNKGRCTPIPVRRWQELLDVVDQIARERSATREPRS